MTGRSRRFLTATSVAWVAQTGVALADNCGSPSDCFFSQRAAILAIIAIATIAAFVISGPGAAFATFFIASDVATAASGRDPLTWEKTPRWVGALGMIDPTPGNIGVRGGKRVAKELAEEVTEETGERALREGAEEVAERPGRGLRPDDMPPNRRIVESEMAAERARRGLSGTAGASRSDTLARVDVNGRSEYGVNSRAASPANNEWRREMFDEVRARTGRPVNPSPAQNQWPFHAEFESLARAWESSGRNLPAQVDMYVDKISCPNCRGGLQYTAEAFGIERLRIFQAGVETPIIITPLP